jgi:hypothetical protein
MASELVFQDDLLRSLVIDNDMPERGYAPASPDGHFSPAHYFVKNSIFL